MTLEPISSYLVLLAGIFAVVVSYSAQRLQQPSPRLVLHAVIAGAIAGAIPFFFDVDVPVLGRHTLIATLAGVASTLWSRANDPSDAILGSALTITIAAAAWIFRGTPLSTVAAAFFCCIAAGAFTAFLLRGRGVERLLWCFFILAVPLAGALLQRLTAALLTPFGALAIGAALPFAAMITFYLSRRGVVALELREEAELGFLTADDATTLSHPLRRFHYGSWKNREARRKYVQVAERLAETKAMQRSMDPLSARLQQLEVLRLRMQLRQIEQVEIASRRPGDGSNTILPDTTTE